MMLWPHPSRRRLTRWARRPDDARIQTHIEQCERCLAVVERTEPAEEIALSALLRTFLSAPDSLEQELVERAEAARARRASLEILAGLAALPWETFRLMIGDEGSDEHD